MADAVSYVRLGHMLARRQQIVSKLTIIRQKQQPLGVLIKSPHWKRSKNQILVRDQINDRPLPEIFSSGNNTRWFMHH
ncbi:hypothetical protein D3C73_1532330 [compost metagenome]